MIWLSNLRVGFLLIELPHLISSAHHPELAHGLRAELRRLLARGRGEHALAVAGHHVRPQDLALDVDIGRGRVDFPEQLTIGL